MRTYQGYGVKSGVFVPKISFRGKSCEFPLEFQCLNTSKFQSELKTYFRFGVGMGIESIPFSMMDDSDTADLDQIEGDEAVPITSIWTLKKPETKQDMHRLADIFKHSVERGYLD
jgi:hypothetical protein